MAGSLGRPKHRRTRLAARYIDQDIVLSDTHAWTYLRLPTVPYEFRSYSAREGIAAATSLALSGLVTGVDAVDCHLIVTTRDVNVDYWASRYDSRVQQQSPAPGWNTYLQRMADHLEEEGFQRREVYLGICLGPRANSIDSGVGGLLAPLKRLISKSEAVLEYEDDAVTDDEIDKWRRKAHDFHRALAQSSLHAQPAHPNAIAWLIAKPLWPDMSCPPPTSSPKRVWGKGEIQSLAEGFITNGHRFLTIEQIDDGGQPQVGYTASLALSRFPDTLLFPDQEPWIYFAASLAFPVDLSMRFQIVPAMKVQRDVKHKLQEAKDQSQHIAETGAMVPLEVQEQLDTATVLEYEISKGQIPWTYGRPRLLVSAPTEQLLHDRVRTVIEHYRELAIDVVWPTGDQLDLLCEAMPGDKVRLRAYEQKQDIAVVAGGMPTASSEVGDRIDGGRGWVGPYIGETTSRVRSMVSFSPHVAMARNTPPGVAIIGSPGGGKSFLAFTLAYQMALSGAWTIYIDPKADAIPMASLPGLGQPRLFDLRNGNDGMLDPFALASTPAEAKLLAIEVVELLLGQAKISEDRENALHRALEQLVQDPSPSLGKLVQILRADLNDKAAYNLGTVLQTYAELPFARLCFAENTGDRLRPEDGLTIVTLLGLDLPSDPDPENYGPENRLAVSVMYLLTRYARKLMLSMDKSHPKAICIDEAWAITSTPQGKKLIPEVARMGRSHNTALVLVSQNAGDLMDQQVTNSISTMFAFRSTNDAEIDNVLTLLGMDNSPEHHLTFKDLRNGECIMRDNDGRLARVHISRWDEPAFHAFDTNPETRGQAAMGGASLGPTT